MANNGVTGELSETTTIKKCIEWNIPNFSSLRRADNSFWESPSFYFVNTSLRLRMYPPYDADMGWLSVNLVQESGSLCSITSTITIKPSDCTLIATETDRNISKFFIKFDLRERNVNLLQPGTLIILCDLKEKHPSTEDANNFNEKAKHMRLTDLDTLSDNFKSLLLSTESYDTTLFVMDKEYKVHKTVLMARSSVFAAMFLHETLEKQTGIVNITDCEPVSFKEFLEYLYSGKFDKPSPLTALHLYETSDKYDVQKLKTFCSEFLMENLTVELLCEVVIMADKYDDKKLLFAAQSFFNKNLRKVFVTSEWNDLLNDNRPLANKLLIEMSSKMIASEVKCTEF